MNKDKNNKNVDKNKKKNLTENTKPRYSQNEKVYNIYEINNEELEYTFEQFNSYMLDDDIENFEILKLCKRRQKEIIINFIEKDWELIIINKEKRTEKRIKK